MKKHDIFPRVSSPRKLPECNIHPRSHTAIAAELVLQLVNNRLAGDVSQKCVCGLLVTACRERTPRNEKRLIKQGLKRHGERRVIPPVFAKSFFLTRDSEIE